MTRRRFTMIELIAVLVIVGVLSAMGMMGLGAGTEGFLRGRDRLEAVGQAQIAMQRTALELRFAGFDQETGDLSVQVSEDGSSVTFVSRRDGLSHVLAKAGSELHYDGKILMDQVSEFQIGYSDTTDELTVSMNIEGVGEFATTLYP